MVQLNNVNIKWGNVSHLLFDLLKMIIIVSWLLLVNMVYSLSHSLNCSLTLWTTHWLIDLLDKCRSHWWRLAVIYCLPLDFSCNFSCHKLVLFPNWFSDCVTELLNWNLRLSSSVMHFLSSFIMSISLAGSKKLFSAYSLMMSASPESVWKKYWLAMRVDLVFVGL